jgi:tRNA pseudouridine32 synthase/23S rRNA pseudouridine746 synthase
MTVTFEHHIKFTSVISDRSNTALSLLCASLNDSEYRLSTSQIKQAISQGALWLTRGKYTQRLRRVKKALLPNDELHFYYNEAVLGAEVNEAILISDEGNYSVWYKPFGMLSQGSKWSDHCTISRFVQHNLTPERAVFIVHRLDKAATGLMLIAHSKKAASTLATMFEERTSQDNMLSKYYQIIVHGDHSINQQPQVIKKDIDGKQACSTFTCLAYDKEQNRSLISVKIDSGRKHQIRIHAASIGLPVVGDRLHGIADSNSVQNLQLCAVSLSFNCPFSLEKGETIKKKFEIPEALKLSFT